ncbi:MAG: NAD-dependent deacylase [Muribaculaceae bacterium]|nr:NAD-dependent deacylase [Muribaculaceae bacterium]
MKNIVFITGAGVSAESGISTFRDSDGLWENYPVMEVASHTGFVRNPALVHQFYNMRRHDLLDKQPNEAHLWIARLERYFNVYVVTQNVDNLHEKGGSSKVLHLHGELMKVRAMDNENLTFTLTEDNLDTTPETVIEGHHVRPHIVFFEEAVPMIEPAVDIVSQADIVIIIGTSLNVYPAAGLVGYARPDAEIYYIDPHPAAVPSRVTVIAEPATKGMSELAAELIARAKD